MAIREEAFFSTGAADTPAADLPMAAFIREDLDGAEVLHVVGEIDLANASDLQASVERLCAGSGANAILDLASCTYIDSTGLRVVALSQRAHRALRVVVPEDGQLRRIFNMTGLSEQLGVFSRLEDSLG